MKNGNGLVTVEQLEKHLRDLATKVAACKPQKSHVVQPAITWTIGAFSPAEAQYGSR